ncbi:MAG: metal ABC transporter permease [Nitrospiraceae bacterium]|nr:metal ABC transporter permease [Nitrospiraceae bacterium]
MMTALLRQPFVENAFIAGTLIAVASAVVGYFVVLRGQAFAAHALSHIGFAGATLAVLIGTSPLLGISWFTVAAALAMGAFGKRIRGRDVEIGIVLAFALGLGVLFLKLYTRSASETASILFGSIFSVTRANIIGTIIMGCASLLLLAAIFRPLLFSSIDPEAAETRGVPIKPLSVLFMFLLAITVAEAIQVVGILLVFALIVAPASIAQHITRKPFSAIALAVALGIAFVWCGLLLSLATSLPVSFYIAALAAVSYFIAVGLSHIVRPHAAEGREHTCR